MARAPLLCYYECSRMLSPPAMPPPHAYSGLTPSLAPSLNLKQSEPWVVLSLPWSLGEKKSNIYLHPNFVLFKCQQGREGTLFLSQLHWGLLAEHPHLLACLSGWGRGALPLLGCRELGASWSQVMRKEIRSQLMKRPGQRTRVHLAICVRFDGGSFYGWILKYPKA